MTDCGKESVSCMEREQEQEKEANWSNKPVNSKWRAENEKGCFQACTTKSYNKSSTYNIILRKY